MQFDGLVEVMNTEAKHLILNDGGEVIGVEAEAKGKTVSYKAKKAVLISTAGFDDGKDLTRSLSPQAYWGTLVKEAGRAAPYANVPTNTGDGIRMGMEIGADLNVSTACVMSDLIYWGGVGGGKQYTGDQPQNVYGSTMTDGSILVNSRGNRFCQEDAHWGYVTSEIYHAIERSGALREDPTATNVFAISNERFVSQW